MVLATRHRLSVSKPCQLAPRNVSTFVISASVPSRFVLFVASCSLLPLFRGHVLRLDVCLMLLFVMWHLFTIWTLFVDPAAPLLHRRDSLLHPQLGSPLLSPQVAAASPPQTGAGVLPTVIVTCWSRSHTGFSTKQHSNLEFSCSFVVMAVYSFNFILELALSSSCWWFSVCWVKASSCSLPLTLLYNRLAHLPPSSSSPHFSLNSDLSNFNWSSSSHTANKRSCTFEACSILTDYCPRFRCEVCLLTQFDHHSNSAQLIATRNLCRPRFITALDTHCLIFEVLDNSSHTMSTLG